MQTLVTWLFPLFFLADLRAQKIQTPKPTPAQIAWHKTEFYLFFHFGPNTFTNLEWGHGTETESLFNPTALDCDQWCRVARAAGAKGVIITAKHHDGFCLWPSQYSRHTVRESRWREGKGDVLRELSDACRRNGLKFGVYLSPWDRNHPKYGTPEYNDVYAQTLKELLTGYGELFEIWWDGANGEGPNGKKQVYDFKRFEKLVRKYQPNAQIFSDIGPGCRWAGNEEGTVAETNWCMLDTAGFGRGSAAPATSVLQTGQENGQAWIPAECDVSIRPGWFYHAEEDTKVKTVDQLFNIYLKSVGRGANLILNVPPDRQGRIHPSDSATLTAFGKKIKDAFSDNLALHKPCYTGSTPIRSLTDENLKSAFSVKNKGEGEVAEIVLDLGAPAAFNCLKLRESIEKTGQKIKSFRISVWEQGQWRDLAHSTTIGARKILMFPECTAAKLKLRIAAAKPGMVGLSEIEVYRIRS